jgi:hypothetical protein
LKHLDKRYRTRYGMSMIENLENIHKMGIRSFVASEEARWACPECGSLVCVHNRYCYGCGKQFPAHELPYKGSQHENT